jgi:hypothetical protein
VLLPGRRGIIQLPPNVLFPVGEILATALVAVRRITATAVTTLVPPVRLTLLWWIALLWWIIRLLLLRCRSGDTWDIWQRDRDPRLLLLRRRERTPQERRNCPSKNDTKLHVNPPDPVPIIYRDRYPVKRFQRCTSPRLADRSRSIPLPSHEMAHHPCWQKCAAVLLPAEHSAWSRSLRRSKAGRVHPPYHSIEIRARVSKSARSGRDIT